MYCKNITRYFLIFLLSTAPAFLQSPLYSQDETRPAKPEADDLAKDGMEEIDSDFYYFFAQEMLEVRVDVASLFEEDEMVLGSTVSGITPNKWKMLGARRTYEALNNEMSVMTYPNIFGSYIVAIRGYTNSQTIANVACILDGVPLNDVFSGAAFYNVPNWELGTLNRIELIKGPGSAIYGADAFHGVLSLKTFESEKDHYSVEGAGAYPVYGDANVKISQGLGDSTRINAAAGVSMQRDQDLEYEYYDAINDVRGSGKRNYEYDSRSGVIKLDYNPVKKLAVKAGLYVSSWACDEFHGSSTIPQNLQDRDYSGSNIIFLMGNSSLGYTFNNKISVEAGGYNWESDNQSWVNISPDGSNSIIRANDRRTGFNLMIKQPENSYNIQLLCAYSYTGCKTKSATMKIRDSNDVVKYSLGELDGSGFSRDIQSVFSQIKWGVLKDRLFLLAGGRSDYYSDFGIQNTPRGGIIFLPDRDSAVKALYGRAFRAPNVTQLFGLPGIVTGDEDLKPETIDVYEIVLMRRRDTWKFTLTGFYSLWKNGIIARPDPAITTPNGKYINKGKNRALGGELNIHFSINPVAADLGFSYVRSEALDSVVPDPDDPDETLIMDVKYNAFPEYSANAGLYYTLKFLELNFYVNNRVYLNMNESPEDPKKNKGKLPPYYRLDVNISKQVNGNLEAYLDIRNVLNRENHIPSVVGAENGYMEQGISVMLRAGYKL